MLGRKRTRSPPPIRCSKAASRAAPIRAIHAVRCFGAQGPSMSQALSKPLCDGTLSGHYAPCFAGSKVYYFFR